MKKFEQGPKLSTERTRKAIFLNTLEFVVPWSALQVIIEPHCPLTHTSQLPFGARVMGRIHCT
jgi:hypothetical protein